MAITPAELEQLRRMGVRIGPDGSLIRDEQSRMAANPLDDPSMPVEPGTGYGRSSSGREFMIQSQPQPEMQADYTGNRVDLGAYGLGVGRRVQGKPNVYMMPNGQVVDLNPQPSQTDILKQRREEAEIARIQSETDKNRMFGMPSAGGARKLSTTMQKELIESDDMRAAAEGAISLLNQAKELSTKAYSGPLASERASAKAGLSNLFGAEDEAANATVQFDNLMTGQALESLKAIFGGMPTEGERKILLDIQASSSKTPEQRQAILDRAIEMANRRMKLNARKAEAIRSGAIEEPGYSPVDIEEESPAIPRGLSSDDKQALDWAMKNQSDPRAAMIMQRLGVR